MATSSLLAFKCKASFHLPLSLPRAPPHNPFLVFCKRSHFLAQGFPKFSFKSSSMDKRVSNLRNLTLSPEVSPVEVIYNKFAKALVSAVILALLLMYCPISAMAASGGRMGGTSPRFSSSRSSSSSSSSRSSSRSSSSSSSSSSRSSSRSSYSSSSSSPYAKSSSSPSPSPSSRSFSPRSSSSHRRRTTRRKRIHSSSSYSSPPSSSSSSSSSLTSRHYAPSQCKGEIRVGSTVEYGVDVEDIIGYALVLAMLFTFYGAIFVMAFDGEDIDDTVKTSVIKLQVGSLGMYKSLQKDLNHIAEVADTSTLEGLRFVLTETSLALLRHSEYCISGYSCVNVKLNMEDAEKHFNLLSVQERGKLDEETLVNMDGKKSQSTGSQRASGFNNEYLVITILVAAEGVHILPAINGSGDLSKALGQLGSIPTRKILSVQVIWTPQSENDILTQRELLKKYPLLKPL